LNNLNVLTLSIRLRRENRRAHPLRLHHSTSPHWQCSVTVSNPVVPTPNFLRLKLSAVNRHPVGT